MRKLIVKALFLASTSLLISSVSAYPIAGVKPDQRPEGAPVIKEFVKDGAWYTNALQGVSSPYPASLHFLENQGAWYTPFNHPGMTGPYDIRNWHKATPKK